MDKPTVDEIKAYGREELERFLNLHLSASRFAPRFLGNVAGNFCVNPWDAASLKEVMRAEGFRFKCAELPDGCAAAFAREIAEETPYQVTGEEGEPAATARAAAITILEQTDWVGAGHRGKEPAAA